MPDPRVWFVTGCSTGFGRAIVERVLARGDRVFATARDPGQLDALVAGFPDHARAGRLDVTDPAAARDAVAQAVAAFGRVDVVVNNAGFGLLGALEEVTDDQVRQTIDANLVGPLNVMRAALPLFRRQARGHFVNMSAVAGFANHAGFAVYGAAKAGLEAASDAVLEEAGPLGVRVTVVCPGPFRTDFIGRSLRRAEPTIPDYAKTSGKFGQVLSNLDGKQPGDPIKAADAIIQVVESDKPPARLVLGKYAYQRLRKKIGSISAELDAWETVGLNTDY